MVFQKRALPIRESTNIDRHPDRNAHPFQGRQMGYWGHDEIAVIVKADEPTVEQVIDARRQQQPILTIEPFIIGGIAPRLTVACA